MGSYVNPKNETKEEFLKREGRVIAVHEAVIADGEYPVCLVDNGPFTAAAIGFNQAEINALSRNDDPRLKLWYQVPAEKLYEVSDLKDYEK